LIAHAQLVQIGDLGMAGLDCAQVPLDLIAVAQLARSYALLECRERPLPARRGAAQDVGLLAVRRSHQIDLEIGAHLEPVVGQQLALELAELAARRAHQVLAAAPAQQSRFSSLTMPRSNTLKRRARPYLRSTRRTIASSVVTSARLPSRIS